jgi:hypothetical protein
MALTKGTDVVALRDLLHARGAAVEQAAMAAMDAAARQLCDRATMAGMP